LGAGNANEDALLSMKQALHQELCLQRENQQLRLQLQQQQQLFPLQQQQQLYPLYPLLQQQQLLQQHQLLGLPQQSGLLGAPLTPFGGDRIGLGAQNMWSPAGSHYGTYASSINLARQLEYPK